MIRIYNGNLMYNEYEQVHDKLILLKKNKFILFSLFKDFHEIVHKLWGNSLICSFYDLKPSLKQKRSLSKAGKGYNQLFK